MPLLQQPTMVSQETGLVFSKPLAIILRSNSDASMPQILKYQPNISISSGKRYLQHKKKLKTFLRIFCKCQRKKFFRTKKMLQLKRSSYELNNFYIDISQHYKTFYGCNKFRRLISKSVCHCQSLLPNSNIYRQGWSLPK